MAAKRLLLALLLCSLLCSALAQELNRLMTVDPRGEPISVTDRAEALFGQLDGEFGEGAVRFELIEASSDGFQCGLEVVKGIERFHSNTGADMVASVISGAGYADKGDFNFVEMPEGTMLFVPAGEKYRIVNADSRYTAVVFCLYPNRLGGLIESTDELAYDFTPTGRRPRFRHYNGTVIDLEDDLEKPAPEESFNSHMLVKTDLISLEAVYINTEEDFQLHQQSSLFMSVVGGRISYQYAGGENPQTINVRGGSFAIIGRCQPYKFINQNPESGPALILKAYSPALAAGDTFAPGDVDCYTTEAPTAAPSAASAVTGAFAAVSAVAAAAWM